MEFQILRPKEEQAISGATGGFDFDAALKVFEKYDKTPPVTGSAFRETGEQEGEREVEIQQYFHSAAFEHSGVSSSIFFSARENEEDQNG